MAPKPSTVECVNPNTGRRMNIDGSIYEMFSHAIYDTLKKSKRPLSFTEMVQGITDRFHRKKISFGGSLAWYAVTVKHDMESSGTINSYLEKGRRLHRLSVPSIK